MDRRGLVLRSRYRILYFFTECNTTTGPRQKHPQIFRPRFWVRQIDADRKFCSQCDYQWRLTSPGLLDVDPMHNYMHMHSQTLFSLIGTYLMCRICGSTVQLVGDPESSPLSVPVHDGADGPLTGQQLLYSSGFVQVGKATVAAGMGRGDDAAHTVRAPSESLTRHH